jgi:CheY-like chemotaxis protein
MAGRLVQVCDGVFQITTQAEKLLDPPLVFSASLAVQIAQQKSVLVIDDNADSLQLIQRYLAGSPYLFIGAQDARRGMELAIQRPPNAVLLDIMMPDQDGWSVLAQLREHLQTSHIPVIVCTLLTQRDLALALGAAGFLRKPISRAEVLATLDHLLVLASPAA